jgi:hypothetical protein
LHSTDGPGPLPGNRVKHDTTVQCTFAYNGKDGSDGSPQRFVVPPGAHSLTIDAYGAQGGGDDGGLGGHAGGSPSPPGRCCAFALAAHPTPGSGLQRRWQWRWRRR